MGLFDGILGQLGGLVGGEHTGLAQNVLGMLQGGGGLSGLVQQFESQGLGHIVSSWIGTGQNLPISLDQLQSVLGTDRLRSMAQSAGVDVSQIGATLSGLLPQIVDKLTPDGMIPKGL